MKLNHWKKSWPLNVDLCPCDVHFVEYLEEMCVTDRVIFHFGTGAHHIVGRANAKSSPPNHIVAVTASREEYAAYIDMAIDDPALATTYKAMFADIYTLSPRILPDFDLVTLFHLCEFYDPNASAYAPLDDRSLLRLFVDKLRPDGRILFYKGSGRFDLAAPIIDEFVARGLLRHERDYQTLAVYLTPPPPSP